MQQCPVQQNAKHKKPEIALTQVYEEQEREGDIWGAVPCGAVETLRDIDRCQVVKVSFKGDKPLDIKDQDAKHG